MDELFLILLQLLVMLIDGYMRYHNNDDNTNGPNKKETEKSRETSFEATLNQNGLNVSFRKKNNIHKK